MQTLLPARPELKQACGGELYRIDGRDYPPEHETGAAPECRIEISPRTPAAEDYFLQVLTAADASVAAVPRAAVAVTAGKVTVRLQGVEIAFDRQAAGGEIVIAGRRRALASMIVSE